MFTNGNCGFWVSWFEGDSMHEELFQVHNDVRIDNCLIYHDESKKVFKNVWAHALFFVPESTSEKLVEKLLEIRIKYGCNNRLHFANISGKKICTEDGSIVIKEWIEHAIEALRSKGSYIFRLPLNCKLGVIFFPTWLELDLYGGGSQSERMLRYFETVLRMLLKGCAHLLYDESKKLKIMGIITDGEPWHRELDSIRVVDRLITNFRDYVEVDSNAYIEGICSDHKSCDCTDYNKAQILQITDLLLGSIIHCCFRDLKYGDKKEKIIRPTREMLEKRNRGRNFRRSGHYKSLSLSFANIKNDQ
ncbi:hypothetical protein KA005_23740, partial [bacterium]|nr:hypothetical protein [bacterium]